MQKLREPLRLAASVGLTVLVLFLLWEAAETTIAPNIEAMYWMHYTRGVSTSFIASIVAAVFLLRQRQASEAELRVIVKERTQEADDAKSLLQAVVDNTPAALFLLDADLTIVEANRLAEQAHGGSLIGKTCYQHIAGRSSVCPDCPVEASISAGVSGTAPGHMTDRRTGEVLALESHPLTLPDGRPGALVVERLVTEQKKLQVRLLHQEKMAAFGLLAAGVAHELGNPLSAVEMHLQLIADDDLPEATRTSLATVREEAARLRRTLREVVDFARRRRDEATLVSVRSVVDDALRLLRHDRRMRDITTDVQSDPETPPVFIVEDHLMQVALNLMINALDAMPDGGKLSVTVSTAADTASLKIADTGIGIDRGLIDRCFEPLFTTKAPGKGTGLGLSICNDIIRDAGGSIELHSSPGAGTTLIVTLPAAKREADAEMAIEPAGQPDDAARATA